MSKIWTSGQTHWHTSYHCGGSRATYARAHKTLLSLKSQLTLHHGWKDTVPADRRMLISIEISSIWKSTGGMPLSPPLKLQLPEHATSFFTPERRVQWQMVFHSDIFTTNRKLSQPIDDIFNLIQCLLTGVVTLVHDEVVPQALPELLVAYRRFHGLMRMRAHWLKCSGKHTSRSFEPHVIKHRHHTSLKCFPTSLFSPLT